MATVDLRADNRKALPWAAGRTGFLEDTERTTQSPKGCADINLTEEAYLIRSTQESLVVVLFLYHHTV